MNDDGATRRDLRLASLAGLASAASATPQTPPAPAGSASMYGVKFDARPKVRIGIVGVGGRGTSLLQNFAAVENVEIPALCDIVREKCVRGQERRSEEHTS